MAKFNHAQPGFIAGQISKRALGRTDLPQWNFACEEMTNFIPLREGAATRRPGSQHVKQTNGNTQARIIPFVFAKDESYAIEITTTTINAIRTSDRSVIAMAPPPESYTTSELAEIQYAQSADVLYLTHPNHKPYTIARIAENSFSVNPFGQDTGFQDYWVRLWPYRDVNISSTTITPSAYGPSGQTITMTASAPLFDVGHVGAFFKLSHNGTTGCVRITSYTSSTVVTGIVIMAMDAGAGGVALSDWEESAWSDYRGWPRTVCFFEGRLIYGGNEAQPDTVWASRVDRYDHLMQRKLEQDSSSNASGLGYYGVAVDSDAASFTIASQQVNAIQWMSGGKSLAIGTLGAEYVGSGISGVSGASISCESGHGSSFVQAKRMDYTVMYVRRALGAVMEMQFDFASNAYVSKNLSQFSDHAPVVQADYQESLGALWCLDSAGNLFGVTRDRDQNMAAWHFHTLGGKSNAGGLPPVVTSVAVVPSGDGTFDDVWLSTRRLINGSVYFGIEIIQKSYIDNDFGRTGNITIPELVLNESPFYSDLASAINCGGVDPITSWSVPYLSGETVSVIADGFALDPLTVASDGTLTLSAPAFNIVVGLPYTPRLKPVKVEAGSVTGSAQGSTKRIDRVVLRLSQTLGCKVGPDYTNFTDINFRPQDLPLSDPIPMFSGDKTISFPGGYSQDGYICIQNTLPLPITVLSIYARGETSDS